MENNGINLLKWKLCKNYNLKLIKDRWTENTELEKLHIIQLPRIHSGGKTNIVRR